MPGVRKGIIGGLSNTMWGTLYFGLPFFNCVDRKLRDGVEEIGEKRSAELLDVNLAFFEVPYCRGLLNAPEARGAGIVQDRDRQGDLIAAIETDLAEAKDRQSCAS